MCVVWCWMRVDRCVLFVVCCMLFVVCCSLMVKRLCFSLFVVHCLCGSCLCLLCAVF